MYDIIEVEDGLDLGIADTIVGKAGNIVSTQVGDLEYLPDFGVDLEFFLEDGFQFQNSSFKAYIIERLTAHQVNVSEVTDEIQTFMDKFIYSVGDTTENMRGLIK